MWAVCITSINHVLKLNGYGRRQAKVNGKRLRFKGWETLVIKYVEDNGALVRKRRCIVLNKKKQKHLGMCLKVVKFAFKHKSNA